MIFRRETYGSKLPFHTRWERGGWTQKGRTIDWDRDRLAFAEDGCLKKARLSKEKLTSIRTLQDFSLPI